MCGIFDSLSSSACLYRGKRARRSTQDSRNPIMRLQQKQTPWVHQKTLSRNFEYIVAEVCHERIQKFQPKLGAKRFSLMVHHNGILLLKEVEAKSKINAQLRVSIRFNSLCFFRRSCVEPVQKWDNRYLTLQSARVFAQ